MCGLAGYVNVQQGEQRTALVRALGCATDKRGGHAAGYVGTVEASAVRYGRKLGQWADARAPFIAGAASADLCIIHARYATCGKKDTPLEAHPFAIKRAGRTALYGAHNGVLQGTAASAARHGRAHDVDSREAFELLADKALDELATEISGYGTLAWIDGTLRDRVRLVTLTEGSDLEICRTACGALVWGSTWDIVHAGLAAAHMVALNGYRVEVGRVLEAHRDGLLTYADHPRVTVSEYSRASFRADRVAAAYAAFDAFDAFDDAPACPACASADTWEDERDGLAYCVKCGHTWTYTTDVADVDAAAFAAWLTSEREAHHAR